jgi:RNA polymerase sigma factor (sigma-70 family)
MSPELESLSDADLLQRCKEGQQTAWHVLVRRYQRLIYTIPRRAGLGEDQAADVFQNTFTRLFESRDRLQDPSRLRAWLVTTARRETLGLLALAQRRVLLAPDCEDGVQGDPLEQIADPSPLPEELLAELQTQDLVRRAVDKLDDKSRAFVELLFLQADPLPYSQIAARLGIAEGSIGPTRARVLSKLRAVLQDL